MEKKLQKKIHIPRIEIAAPKSGSGKTLFTVGLLSCLRKANRKPCSFKCGPDFIDPMFHRSVLGIHSGNLDSYFSDDDTLCHIMISEYENAEADIALIEGVMGFFDGLGGINDEASSYEISCITKTPVILILDAKGASLSLVPMIKGFLSFRNDSNIKGIVLNKVSSSYFPTLKKMIEEECQVKVLGFLPEKKELIVPSRHLGLISPDEAKKNNDFVKEMEKLVKENIDVDEIIKISEEASDLCDQFSFEKLNPKESSAIFNISKDNKVNILDKNSSDERIIPKILVAFDEAFSFYYEENLNLLRELGTNLIFFSPIHDKKIPDDISGLYLGGGYPELYARELSKNTEMKEKIKNMIIGGLPTIAECGGFLYLCNFLEGENMAGLFSSKAIKKNQLVRFGYVEGVSKKDGLFGPNGTSLKGHEFHYYETEDNGDGFSMKKPISKKTWDAINYSDTFAIGFPHFYWYSNIYAIKNFVKKCMDYSLGQ